MASYVLVNCTRSAAVVIFLCLYLFCSHICVASSVRGVALTRLPFYDPSKDFTCLDGLLTIPFNSVNDDYCDCSDGSDEPGTPACSNGIYHCTNAGFRPKNIPSSRVNDGLCDCCDGSDEYDGSVSCPNTCKELYKELYQRQREDAELAKQGLAVKQDYSRQGQEKKEDRKQKLEELKKQLEEKKAAVESLRAKKEEVEAIEKEAKDKHENEWKETKAKILAERDRASAEAAFKALDVDEDGRLTVQEIVDTELLDKKYNDEEAKELLGGYEDTDFDSFYSVLWSNVKEKYLHNEPKQPPAEEAEEKPTEAETPATDTENPPPSPPIDESFDEDEDLPDVPGDDEDEDEEDADDMGDDREPSDELKHEAEKQAAVSDTEESKDDDLKMPEFDEETKAKISAADQARKEFNDADTDSRDTEREISELERTLDINLGQEEEFAPLHGQCFEYTDREYLYKLCPFDKASQQPKGGGSETSLGTWGEWTGDPNKYSRMKYSGGQSCWNGPSRSAEVNLRCGSTNEVIQVSEPSRCEYLMEFKTPAACQNSDGDLSFPHEHGGEL
ncbi:glucosidase 2 subunit beta-like [Montipora foliosa]|uniref:glucosidase 2 subunit beta-like n=1 Tax=Montipora foliosa TaxID=591990 RepID=UPI0035F1CA39